MSQPHFHEEHVVEREVRPRRTRRTVVDYVDGPVEPAGTRLLAAVMAAVLVVFILVLVFGFLL